MTMFGGGLFDDVFGDPSEPVPLWRITYRVQAPGKTMYDAATNSEVPREWRLVVTVSGADVVVAGRRACRAYRAVLPGVSMRRVRWCRDRKAEHSRDRTAAATVRHERTARRRARARLRQGIA